MSTTTIRLSEEMKARIARAAERAGTTPHNFILQAISEKTAQEERRAEFHDEARKRLANIIATGKTIAWEDMRAYMEQRAAGKLPPRPLPRKLVR
ncbi:ribbon-helix-helix protein, CopG family [Cupriavidus gilardii]|uniref:CopG family ribbon-helix-helix protein n=1 Tax=Cupriavidus gilardii TaxID=82541 RepID=UPI001574B00A|nr:DUF1778 domain-containing protein [Cupriavidus gilardii]MCG5259250.1 DUF1778 domain-containing protein [Cupriavidus gilardii]MDF9428666.1 ribbon-helix-helix protein, CopG family [Cupriavidus gilardii]NSX03828.1 ribbon-helix-helix protein, CopG family [Cupriavidus gilardii]